jgi:hypothetical protein
MMFLMASGSRHPLAREGGSLGKPGRVKFAAHPDVCNLQRIHAACLRSSDCASLVQATKPASCPSAEEKSRAKHGFHDKNIHAITLSYSPWFVAAADRFILSYNFLSSPP